jgi:uncharacterized protein (TIRG00374 family)
VFGDKKMTKKGLKRASWALLRFSLAAAIIYFLIHNKKSIIIDAIKGMELKWLAAALLCYSIGIFTCVLRWYSLLKMQKIALSFLDTLFLSMQGIFFSLMIPGSVGGDLAKIGLVSFKTDPNVKLKAAFSILIDRVVGLVALFLLAGIFGAIVYSGIDKSSASARIIVAVISSGCIVGVLASSFLFFHRVFEKLPPVKKLIVFADKRTKGIPSRIMSALDEYRASYLKVILWIIISAIFVHGSQGMAIYFIARGTGCADIIPAYAILFSAVGNAVGAVPITPSGIGTRDAVLSLLFETFGLTASKAISISLINTAIVISFGLFAGVFFVLDSYEKKRHAEHKQ